ncbi:polycomb protein Sfmbt [Amyelois transitella]|uniref:polycomb protein Sfmbt n=1 Tax=Amyelois transitella TaxID=680683 RepID=UPI002990238D|nr:polycomb protein Sfmbt [Amyelois transitella]
MAFCANGDAMNVSYSTDISEENNIVDNLSIIPLEKDSFAICELCGLVGRRGQFYVRNNKFCSLRCHSSSTRRRNYNWRFKLMEGTDHMAGMIPLEPLPQLQQWQVNYNDLQDGPLKQSASLVANSYEWKDELFGCDFLAAPVSLFKHAPLNEMWDSTFEGMKVEVKNNDCDNPNDKNNDFFWVATVLKVKGYMGLLRYEGFGSDDSKDFWVNLCCSEVHPVGWCATRGKPLIPPRTIEDKYADWKKFLVKQLTGARTLPANFYSKLNDSLVSRFSVGSVMEVVDKNRISQVKVATVCEIIGKRLHVKYYDSSPEDDGFWCHEDSPLIHPVGWAFRVGHRLAAPPSYCQRVAAGRPSAADAAPELFRQFPADEPPLFAEGMKLEAIDPLNLSAVCAATVMQTLREGYVMVRIEQYPADAARADWFCYHQRSPAVFPAGFARAHHIPLVPPLGYSAASFSWEQYLAETGSVAAPPAAFGARASAAAHGFVAGMRLECADLMDPRLVCVATVARVVQDMLKVHFDGWGAEYDQWVWARSTDVFPVGWCRAVRHRLEGPLQPPRRHASKNSSRAPTTTEENSQNSQISEPPNNKSVSSPSEPDIRELVHAAAGGEPEQEPEETPTAPAPDATPDAVEPPDAVGPPDTVAPPDAAEPPDAASPPDADAAAALWAVGPEQWARADVARFLALHACQAYAGSFAHLDGRQLLQLSKDDIVELMHLKVGPALKIYDLVQQLKLKIKQPSRLLAGFKQ